MKKAKRQKIESDVLTYITIANMAVNIKEMLEQYNTYWMSVDLKKAYIKLAEDAGKLEMIADKLANYELVD